MQNMQRLKVVLLVIFFLFAHSSVAKENKLRYGKIDAYTLGSLTIVIADDVFELSHDLRVLNEHQRSVSHAALTLDRSILYRAKKLTGHQHYVITEIRLLGPGT